MAESNDGQERTEQPTPRKLQQAREKGQVPRSRELTTLAVLLAASMVFIMMGPGIMKGLTEMVTHGLSLGRDAAFDEHWIFIRLREIVLQALRTLAPFFLLVFVIAILSSVMLGGIALTGIKIKPEKLNPVSGLKRIFAWRGVMEMSKGLAKFVLIASVGILILRVQSEALITLGLEPLPQALAHMGRLVGWGFLILSATLLLVVLIDVPFQLWDHQRQLKMTRQEVKEEFKQTEGSPEIKGKQRQIQMQMAQRRMMQEVPKADVVITNPTHYAVALRYDADRADAPVVVAKGVDMIALRIRSIASEHDVPILSAPPLARSLYHTTDLNAPIPTGLYHAVAQVLAYVYRIRDASAVTGARELSLNDLPIPDELRRDE